MKDRIRKIRKDANMTQTEFGQAIGVTFAALSKYELGKVIPDKSIRLLICQRFNVSETWLETGEGKPYKEGLIPELVHALRQMPAAQAALERILPRLTPEDLQHINSLLEKFLAE